MGRNGPWIGGQLTERPSNIFRKYVRVAPYPEDDIPWIVENLGGDDRCLVMGSDFPHAEGIAEPADFEKLLDPLADEPNTASCAATPRRCSTADGSTDDRAAERHDPTQHIRRPQLPQRRRRSAA